MPFNWPDTIDIVVEPKHLNDDEKIAILVETWCGC